MAWGFEKQLRQECQGGARAITKSGVTCAYALQAEDELAGQRERRKTPVYINIYDLSEFNSWISLFGAGGMSRSLQPDCDAYKRISTRPFLPDEEAAIIIYWYVCYSGHPVPAKHVILFQF